MTRTPRSSTKRIARTEAARKVSKAPKRPGKPAERRRPQVPKKPAKAKVRLEMPRTRIEPIAVNRTEIDYDPTLAATRGYLAIASGTPPLRPPHGDTLLHLLFFLIYTQEGGELLRANGPTSAATPEQAKDNLKAALLRRFPTIDSGRPDSVLDPVIDAHFAADWYVGAVKAKSLGNQAAYQAMYAQKLLAILGELHDDAMAHEFSMLW